jgi:hypothetical protein
LDSDDEYKPHHLRACLAEIENLDLICSTTETIVNSDADYYVPDKDDHTQLIHLDETVLFGTLFGRKNVFHALQFKSGFAADADFFEKASALFRVKKVNLRTYIYHRTMPNSICATLIKANLSNAL